MKTKKWIFFITLILYSASTGATGARYLIITPDAFASFVEPLARWKTAKGMLAKIVTTSEIGTDTNQIRSYICYAWNNWDIPPEYILLLGSPEYIPSFTNNNDNYYGNMTGDFRIEVPVGRFPAHNPRECSTFVAKVLAYENPPAGIDTMWFRKGTTIVREDVPPDSYYQKDAQILRAYWQERNFLLAESLCNLYGDSSRQVNYAGNDGRIFITYRGNGVGSWYSPFNAVTPASWQNGIKMPVVVSATCATVTLSPGETMYGDQFVRAGSPSALGGVIAFFGTTRSGTHLSRFRSACYRGFFHALYEEGEHRLGSAALRGRHWVDSIYGDSIRYLEWNLLGDPELNVWIDAPLKPDVIHDSVVPMAQQNFTITVKVAGTPFPSAQVCVSMDTLIYEYGQTDSLGQVTFTIQPQSPGRLQIVVSGKNILPYIGSCEVVSRDVSCISILAPAGTVDSGTVVYPVVKLFNYGSRTETYPVFMQIGSEYARSETVQLHQPNTDYEIVFPRFTAQQRGSWGVICSTGLTQDQHPENNRCSTNFFIRVRDVGVAKILVPSGSYTPGAVITPAARWENYGNINANFQAWLIIESSAGARIYINRQDITMAPGDSEPLVIFRPCTLSSTGTYVVRCSTYYPYDQVSSNNRRSANFIVTPLWNNGWQEVLSMPAAPSGSPVSDGGWLVSTDEYGMIYAAKGNKTGDFYAYDPIRDSWTLLMPIPEGPARRFPKKGASAVGSGQVIFMAKGNGTFEFWCYETAANSWRQLPDIPQGPDGKKVKGGTDLVYVTENDTGYVYLLKGGSREFYCFNTTVADWQRMPDAPAGIKPKWSQGSWLVYDQKNTIYAHKAKYHELWTFDLSTHQWSSTPLPGIPVSSRQTGKNKKSRDGGSAVFYNDNIYALKGGNTCEFWKFDPLTRSWSELDTMPQFGSTGKKKRVNRGGDITHLGGGTFFALKGNKTLELWRYVENQPLQCPAVGAPVKLDRLYRSQPSHAEITLPSCLSSSELSNLLGSQLLKNAHMEIYDPTGRKVMTAYAASTNRGAVPFPACALNPGIYILHINRKSSATTRKLVIVRR